jgi:predicted ATPase
MRAANWYVITGAPSSGKTSVICELERLGYRVVHEVARAFIDEELKKGKTIEQIKADELAFERHILYKKIKIEESLPKKEIIFLDRAVPDSIAYFKSAGLNPNEPVKKSKLVRYKKIFLFERLEFEKDRVRSENQLKAAEIELLLEKAYQMLDYDIVYVPVLSIQKRTDFILQHL